MNPASIEDKLAVNKYDVDKEVHITIREDICKKCNEYYCVYACPAGCFKIMEEHITLSYEGCLECGSCQIVCEEGAVNWTLPRPGFGICYQYG